MHGADQQPHMGRTMGEQLEHVGLAVGDDGHARSTRNPSGGLRRLKPAHALAVLEAPAAAGRLAPLGALHELRVQSAQDRAAPGIHRDQRAQRTAAAARVTVVS